MSNRCVCVLYICIVIFDGLFEKNKNFFRICYFRDGVIELWLLLCVVLINCCYGI